MTDAPERPTPPAQEVSAHPEPEQVMDLLAGHVPLALLMDLVTPDGPPSDELLRTEGLPDDAWWEPDTGAAPPAPARDLR